MKSKKLLWILAIVFLVVGSVMVEAAIGDVFGNVGTGLGKITGGASILVFLVNIVIIGIAVYVLMTTIGKKYFDAKSKTGKGVFFAVLIFLSGIIANRVGNRWIWEKDVVIKVFNYLFSGTDPIGILWPTRILIFLGAAALLSWLFIRTVKIGQGKTKVDITIATILAAELTRQGLTKSGLVGFGQIISIWLLYKSFKRDGEDNKFSLSAIWWAAGLVVWISAVAFPGIGILGGLTNLVKSIGYFRYALYLVIGGVIVTVGYKWVAGREKKAGDGKWWDTNALQYIRQPFLNVANKLRIPFIGSLLKKWDLHDITPGAPEREEFSFSIRKVWVELFNSLNYLLRSEVYHAKGGAVEKTLKDTIKIFDEKDVKIYSKETIHMWIDLFKNGTGYRKVKRSGSSVIFEVDLDKNRLKEYTNISNDGEVKAVLDEKGKPTKVFKEGFYGWLDGRFMVFRFLEKFKDDLEGVTEISKVEHENQELESSMKLIKDNFGALFNKTTDSKRRHDVNTKRIDAMRIVDSYKSNILNQLNKSGNLYRHNYKFARKGAQIYEVNCYVDKNKDPPFGQIIFDKDPKKARKTSGIVQENLKHEVDQYGFFLEDWNNFKIAKKGGNTVIRRVMFKDVIDHPDFREPCRWQATEWDYYIKDFRDGRFHPMSRTALDYTEMHTEKRKYNYSGVKQTHGAPERGNAAFDREALKDTGRFFYLGRINAGDEREDGVNVPVENPFPAVTSIGLSTYINSYINEFAKESGKKQRRHFAWETGQERKKGMFTNYPENKGGN